MRHLMFRVCARLMLRDFEHCHSSGHLWFWTRAPHIVIWPCMA